MTSPPEVAAASMREADARALATALRASRADTLATFAAFERALPGLRVPPAPTVNPPLWELGHVGWFQEFWITRNPQRAAGAAADPDAPRTAGVRRDADALYDSSRVPHDTRWSLALPDAFATRADLDAQLDATLELLRQTPDDAAALYFFRLALFHEDMHHEAALYMAQSLGIAIGDARWQPRALAARAAPLEFDAGRWTLGHAGAGFAFDNECGAHEVDLPATQIDSRVVRWDEYLPFVESVGGAAPRYLRRDGAGWQHWRHGVWHPLDRTLPAAHLTAHEAEAWCRWAGRRLPTEAEWERAAAQRQDTFAWGEVWEWTASAFEPYPGFAAHPYRDYSQPWFGTRRVLRGASFMTQPRLRDVRYRNFFSADRSDVPAGFRSCRL